MVALSKVFLLPGDFRPQTDHPLVWEKVAQWGLNLGTAGFWLAQGDLVNALLYAICIQCAWAVQIVYPELCVCREQIRDSRVLQRFILKSLVSLFRKTPYELHRDLDYGVRSSIPETSWPGLRSKISHLAVSILGISYRKFFVFRLLLRGPPHHSIFI